MTEPEEHTNPPDSRICHECGTTIAAGVKECPRCALAAELGSKGFEVDLEALAADLPQLEILEEIGRGGMGVVFKARQKRLGRDVAIKVLPKELDYDPSFSDRFLRECRTLAGLSHPNVVTVYDAGVAAGHNYLLMEFVDGTDLAKLMRSAEVQSEQALSIVSQICEALQYAHDQGVVHRDIKPGNILLDREGHVKLGDFGLAKLLRNDESMRLTGTLQAMGTPQYMAPEQLERPLEVDHRADLYSLGVVLYELLTGELPLGRFEAPSKRADVDVGFDEVVMKTLEKEPDQRYQSASEVRMEVQRASDAARGDGRGRPRNVSATGAGDQPSKKGAKHFIGGGLFVLSVLVLLYVVGLLIDGFLSFTEMDERLMSLRRTRWKIGFIVVFAGLLGVAGWSMRRSDRRRREGSRGRDPESTAVMERASEVQDEGAAEAQLGSEDSEGLPDTVADESGGEPKRSKTTEISVDVLPNASRGFKIGCCVLIALLLAVVVLFIMSFLVPSLYTSRTSGQVVQQTDWVQWSHDGEEGYFTVPFRSLTGLPLAGWDGDRWQDWEKDAEWHEVWNANDRELFNFIGDRPAASAWLEEALDLGPLEAVQIEEALQPVREEYERQLIAASNMRVLESGEVVGSIEPFLIESELEDMCKEAIASVRGRNWEMKSRRIINEQGVDDLVGWDRKTIFFGPIGDARCEFTFRRLHVPVPEMNWEDVGNYLRRARVDLSDVDPVRLLADEEYAYGLGIIYDLTWDKTHDLLDPQRRRGNSRPEDRKNYWLDNDMRVLLAHALNTTGQLSTPVISGLDEDLDLARKQKDDSEPTEERVPTAAEHAAEFARGVREAGQEEALSRHSAFAVHGVSAHECEVELADWFALKFEVSAAEAEKIQEELADVFVRYLEAERNASTIKQLPDGTLIMRTEEFLTQDGGSLLSELGPKFGLDLKDLSKDQRNEDAITRLDKTVISTPTDLGAELLASTHDAFSNVLGERAEEILWGINAVWEFPYGREIFKTSLKSPDLSTSSSTSGFVHRSVSGRFHIAYFEYEISGIEGRGSARKVSVSRRELINQMQAKFPGEQFDEIDGPLLSAMETRFGNVEDREVRGEEKSDGESELPRQMLRFLPTDDGPIFGLWEGRPILLPQAKLHYDLDVAEIARWNEVLTRRWQELMEIEEEFIEVSRDEDGVIVCRLSDSFGEHLMVLEDGKQMVFQDPFKGWIRIVGESLNGELILVRDDKIRVSLEGLGLFFTGLPLRPGDRVLIQETEDGIYVTKQFDSYREPAFSDAYRSGEIPQWIARFIEAAGD